MKETCKRCDGWGYEVMFKRGSVPCLACDGRGFNFVSYGWRPYEQCQENEFLAKVTRKFEEPDGAHLRSDS